MRTRRATASVFALAVFGVLGCNGKLEVGDDAKQFLAEVGWDPQFGARPLKRAIQKYLEDGLARRVIAGDFVPGDTIAVRRGSDGLSFEKKARAPSEMPANGRPRAQA